MKVMLLLTKKYKYIIASITSIAGIYFLLLYFNSVEIRTLPEKMTANNIHPIQDDMEYMAQDPVDLTNQKEQEKRRLSSTGRQTDREAHEVFNKRQPQEPVGVIIHEAIGQGKTKQVGSATLKEPSNNSLFKRRIVHLDLKGAPPKIDYLVKLLPTFRALGATGVLIEYEDMFPYWGEIAHLSAHNAYSKEDIAALLDASSKNNLDVIPLLQTFGHMEFVLKLEKFMELREVSSYPRAICPTNPETNPLIKRMVAQVMELHPNINWLHIGSDEVYNVGVCARCEEYMNRKQITKYDLFMEHVTDVAKHIKTAYDVQPIMWDDELRKIPAQTITNSTVAKYVEIMVWYYAPGILQEIDDNVWHKYGNIFDGVWVASAFKGASYPNSFFTDIGARLANNREWTDVVRKYKDSVQFRGIALTGWQRFDHFSVLCELLPVSLPSLAICLDFLMNENSDQKTSVKASSNLGCESNIGVQEKSLEFVNHCSFPGSKLYDVGQKLYMRQQEYAKMVDSRIMGGWVTEYNIKHKFSSPELVENALESLSALLFEYKSLYTEAESALSEVYDIHTTKEWIQTYLDPTAEKLEQLFRQKKLLLSQTHWPRRPLDVVVAKDL